MRMNCLFLCLVATASAANAMAEDTSRDQPERPSLSAPTPLPAIAAPAREWKAIQEDRFLLKGQATYVAQTKPAFQAAYTLPGFNSLSSRNEQSRTATATAYLGARLWRDAEFYVNEEMVIGVPFSDLHGLAAVPNSEIQKASGPNPLIYTPRAFLRQTWRLGGNAQQVPSDLNQLAGAIQSHRLVLSVGKLSVMDIFDGNAYAHDGRHDFFNWVNVAGGAYDYAADVRGFSIGAALEYYNDQWAFRVGRFMVPRQSNGLQLDYSIAKFHGDQVEIEHSHSLGGLPGKWRALVFRNVEMMGRFDDALAYATEHGGAVDVANVRRANAKYGYVLGLEQSLATDLNVFARLSWNNGQTEMFTYTEVERSASVGASLGGSRWNRGQDTLAIAFTGNGLSQEHQDYLAAGGTGFLIGDGRLNYRTERLVEAYYSLAMTKSCWLTANWQHIVDPAYNADRGPVNIFGVRLHTEF